MAFTKICQILFLSLIVKIFIAWLLPVLGDESYYWFWGQYVQLSYLDHPAMVGWLTHIGSTIPFLPYSLSVRWPFVLMSTFSLFIFIKILNENSATSLKLKIALIGFYLLNPMLGFGGVLATPDVPLVFFWTLSYWFMLQIIKNQKIINYALLGAALGLGLCSKYHIVLFPLSIILALFFSKKLSVVQPKKLLLTVIMGFIFSLPVLIWNANNEWVSFTFQLNHGLNGRLYSPFWMITYILGQIFLFNPFLFYNSVKLSKPNFIQKSALVQWGFFLISSMRATVEANWPVTAHIQGLSSLNNDNKKILRLGFIYWLVIWAMFIGIFFTPTGQEKLNKLPQSFAAEKIWNQINTYAPLYGPSYQMSSLLHLIGGKQILKLSELGRIDFYDSPQFQKPEEKEFYTLKYDITDWPEWLKNSRFEVIKKFPEYSLALYRVHRE